MSRKFLLLSVMATLLLCAALVVWPRQELGLPLIPDTQDPGPGAGADLTQVPGTDGAGRGVGAGGPRRSEVAGPAWTVRGRVWRGYKGRYPAARIRARLFESLGDRGEPALETELVADRDARFAWPLDPPRGHVTLSFGAAEDGHYAFSKTLSLAKGASAPGSIELYLFPLDAWVSGKVTDLEGRPIPGARVYSRQTGSVECDRDGRYRIPAASSLSEINLGAYAPGFAYQRGTCNAPKAGELGRIDFRLKSGFQVFGKVRDERGRLLAGVRVFAGGSDSEAQSDAGGSYRLERLAAMPRGRSSISLFAWHEDHATTRARVEPRGEDLELDLVMKPGVPVAGLVLDSEGRPVEGALVKLAEIRSWRKAVSASDGSFRILGVTPGTRQLSVEHRRHAAEHRRIQVKEGTGLDNLLVRLGAQGSHFLAGRVTDQDRKPLADIMVWVGMPRAYGGGFSAWTRSDSSGRFRIENLPGKTLSVDVNMRGYLPVREETRVDRTDLHLELKRAGILAGRVVDGRSGEPIPNFKIRLVSPGVGYTWFQQGHSFTETDGYFDSRSARLEPGTVHRVEASAPGYAPAIEKLTAKINANPEAALLRLFEGATIQGWVRSKAGGRPVAGARVQLLNESRSRDPMWWDNERFSVQSDASGLFRIEHVSPGKHSLSVEHEDFSPKTDGPFEVSEQATVLERTVLLRAGGRVEGVVLDEQELPLLGARVTLSAHRVPGPRPESRTTKADERGRFGFDGLADGVYLVRAKDERRGKGSYSGYVVVKESEPGKIRLGPRRGSSNLIGVVIYEETLPENVHVFVRPAKPDESIAWEERQPPPSTTLENGSFEIRGLEPGEYRISVFHRHPGSNSMIVANGKALLNEGRTTRVTLQARKMKRR